MRAHIAHLFGGPEDGLMFAVQPDEPGKAPLVIERAVIGAPPRTLFDEGDPVASVPILTIQYLRSREPLQASRDELHWQYRYVPPPGE